MSHHTHILTVLVLGVLLATPTPAVAQQGGIEFPTASPPAFARDRVGLTTVEIEYARPGVKDRTIFGGLIPYGEAWRTGANAATRITFSTDVTFGGEALAAGTYALFTIPGEREWTIILNSGVEQWGSYNRDAAQDVVSIVVPNETLAAPVETMRLSIEHIRDDSAHLTFAWETSGFRVPIEIDLVSQLAPKIEAAMAAPGEGKPYLAAAMFYYEHDVDIDKALKWGHAAAAQQPDAVWVHYRVGLIQAKAGDTDGARASARKTVELAGGMDGELGSEYRRLGESLLASLDDT